MAKIVLFADGTGNARTAQFRTNVWKLYIALDSRPASGQVAFYHDGVGTSAFAPLRLLGGVFGLGLGRNIQALYAFLCRNLNGVDDEIHLFGFSRGAFTVRILAGLIHHEGVRHIGDEAELAQWVRDAYRRNRMRLALEQMGFVRRSIAKAGAVLLGVGRNPKWSSAQTRPKIELVGVWDTVAAYGGPIIEMVRGFDRWVWPLSMPDYKLCASVRRARHALSLDEEREAFLPLPWDEVGSDHSERIRQVWFAGVHSDVGGGYADDGLSSIALAWMLDEAKAVGLSFIPAAEAAIRDNANSWAPMHDSRSGVAVAYRYQPRSINALMGLTPNSPLRDPDSGNQPMMKDVIIHDSVIARIRDPDGYAPIVLPSVFHDDSGCHFSLPPETRDDIWAHVTTRQLLQRLLLMTATFAMFAPLYPKPPPIVVSDQLLAPFLGIVFGLVPFLPNWLRTAYGGAGSWLLVSSAAVALWLMLGERERTHIDKLSADMWARRSITPAGTVIPGAAASRGGWRIGLSRAVRRSLRWQILPGAFGIGFCFVMLLLLITVINQVVLICRETAGDLCPITAAASSNLATAKPCNRLGFPVLAAHRYRVRLLVNSAWHNTAVATSPLGFTYVDSLIQRWHGGAVGAIRAAAIDLFGIVLRREITARWFQPIIAIRSSDSRWLYKVALLPQRGTDGIYYAHFVAPADGDTSIYVNDAIAFSQPDDNFYSKNQGCAQVDIADEN